MGNYIFDKTILVDELKVDAENDASDHDFGKNIIKKMMAEGKRLFVYDFNTNRIPSSGEDDGRYWRDVGNIDAYWEAHMDLVDVSPSFNLYDEDWHMRTHSYQAAPTKFVFDHEERRGTATDSLVSGGCIISGGRLHRCVLSPYCRINSFSSIEESILLHGVEVGRHSQIKKAIIDKGVKIPPGTEIGIDAEFDRSRGFFVSEGGVTVVAKGTIIIPQEHPEGKPAASL